MPSAKVKKSISRWNCQRFERKNAGIKRKTIQNDTKPVTRQSLFNKAIKLQDF